MTAFRATYSDLKLIKTRKCVQIIFEVPQEDFDAAYEVLGGLPNPAVERWFGIAALSPGASAKPHQDQIPRPDGAKRDWRDLPPAQQAGIRCGEAAFVAFLKEEHSDHWHEGQTATDCVRLICGVASRSELGTNQKARVIWHQLNSQYEAWRAMERA
jgi:hypothetical protein